MFTRNVRLAVCALFVFLAVPGAASAHPLGNFTINHLSELSLKKDRANLRYVLDMAEIPTYQALREISQNVNVTPAQLSAWAAAEAKLLSPQLVLTEGSTPLAFVTDHTSVKTRPGAGGLPLLYFVLDAHAVIPASDKSVALSYRDKTFPGRLGWHDVVVAPATEPTHELLIYPSALIGSPRNLLAADLTLEPNGTTVVSMQNQTDANSGGAPAQSVVRSNLLSDMLARGTNNWVDVLLTLLIAVALGALHALEPGHGKTLLAISLVGARATVKQAGILAGSLTVAHTIGVIALGVAINLFKGYFVPEDVYPWITLLSGAAIAIIGARAVQQQLQARSPLAHAHAHGHAATHDHSHDHVHHADAHDHAHGAQTQSHGAHSHGTYAHAHGDHDHGAHTHDHDDAAHARSHAIPGTAPLKFGATVWAAMSGGIAPCPAALVVLLAAVALNNVAYGIVAVIAFSFGLAATLTGLGIGVVRGATWLQERKGFDRFIKFGPLASGVMISVIGAFLVGQGFAEKGITISPSAGVTLSQIVISIITALAIAAFAFSHPFTHRSGEIA